jgi:hypothetical protein
VKIQVSIIIAGQIDSKALWKLVEPYKINVTDFGYETWVHGKVDLDDVSNIISLCCRFGKVKVCF